MQEYRRRHHPDLGEVSKLPEVPCMPLQVGPWPGSGGCLPAMQRAARAHCRMACRRGSPTERGLPFLCPPLSRNQWQYLLDRWGITEVDLMTLDVGGAE